MFWLLFVRIFYYITITMLLIRDLNKVIMLIFTWNSKSLETREIRRQAASASGNVEGGRYEERRIDMPPDNDQARTQEMVTYISLVV
jgi:hypothetical protein